MAVYLLHFEQPIGDLTKRHGQAQHYIGWAQALEARITHHRNGTSGVAIMAAVSQRGLKFEVARVWEAGDRTFERHLKNSKAAPRLCPICSGPGALRRQAEPVTVSAPEPEPVSGAQEEIPF